MGQLFIDRIYLNLYLKFITATLVKEGYSINRPGKVFGVTWEITNRSERHHRTKHVMKKIFLTIFAIGMLFAVGLSFVTPLYSQADELGVKVMSYNIYRGGTMRRQPLSQTAKAIQEAKADVVGVQETLSPKGDNAEKLAALLGWNLYVGRRHKCIMTRHEIADRLDGGIKIKMPSGQHAYIFTLHLASNPYQPY